jgi:hypothetical protein
MNRFTDWLKSAWNIGKNIVGKVGGFIGKAVPIVLNIGNFMSYLPGNKGKIGQTFNNIVDAVDSFTGMLPGGIKDKIEKYTGKGSVSNNMNNANNIISRASNNFRKIYDPGDQS